MSDKNPIIFCVDIGKFNKLNSKNKFGWASSRPKNLQISMNFAKELPHIWIKKRKYALALNALYGFH